MQQTAALNREAFLYPSRRMPLLARHGVVATSQPLAAVAGLEMLQRGGNAVDAALATAIALTVVQCTSNGIGGDAFALVWDGKRLHGLNGSGRSPATHTPELFAGLGHTTVPMYGWLPVNVPGTPATWRDLHARFGRLPFATLFEPAIRHAEEGHPVAPVNAQIWAAAYNAFAAQGERSELRDWFSTFAPKGRAPHAGEIWASPAHAATLRAIADSNAEEFYRGRFAEAIEAHAAATGGYLTRADLAAHTSEWVEPISVRYRDHEVWEIPPNGHGISALMALNILEGFEIGSLPRESAEAYHLQIEAMKIAYADAFRYVGDPAHVNVPVAGLLDKGYAAERRRLIGERAICPPPGQPPSGGTVYLCAADGDGMMVSYIQSNYKGFGSGVVVPGTGIALHNRGLGFSLEPGHANEVAPGKRPYHTIIPGFLTRGGEPVGPFGVMGAFMQPQGHVQMVLNQVDWGMNPQTSLDAPRWYWKQDLDVDIEAHAAAEIVDGLRARGHHVEVPAVPTEFGMGQIIRRLENGVLLGASEPRADGFAVGW